MKKRKSIESSVSAALCICMKRLEGEKEGIYDGLYDAMERSQQATLSLEALNAVKTATQVCNL